MGEMREDRERQKEMMKEGRGDAETWRRHRGEGGCSHKVTEM